METFITADITPNHLPREEAEAQELIRLYAQEIVDKWPALTIRTMSQMTARVETLRQALAALTKK